MALKGLVANSRTINATFTQTGAQAADTINRVCGFARRRPAPLLVKRERFKVGSSLPTNRITGSFRLVDMLGPGAAGHREGVELLPVELLAVNDRVALAFERRDQQARLVLTGNVFSPGRSICTKKVMVLNTGWPLVGSIYSTIRPS